MKKLLTTILSCLTLTAAITEGATLQASLTPEVAAHPRNTFIEGLCLNLWGENSQHALAIGLVNGSTDDSAGISLAVLNYAENYKGVHLGLVNSASGQFSGVQAGWLFGFSVVNYANSLTGLQLGIVNYADTAENGIQIGVLNLMNETDTWFHNFPNEIAPGMVLINWRL